jgi:hypothetical protein
MLDAGWRMADGGWRGSTSTSDHRRCRAKLLGERERVALSGSMQVACLGSRWMDDSRGPEVLKQSR